MLGAGAGGWISGWVARGGLGPAQGVVFIAGAWDWRGELGCPWVLGAGTGGWVACGCLGPVRGLGCPLVQEAPVGAESGLEHTHNTQL